MNKTTTIYGTKEFKCDAEFFRLDAPLPADEVEGPTNAQPGSEEKIKVLMSRSYHGLPLWNPGDYVHQRRQWDGTA